MLGNLQQRARSAFRDKSFASAVVVTVSVCIAVNVTIFAIVHSVLLRPLPFPHADRIVLMANRYPRAGVGNLDTSSPGDYYDRRERMSVFREQAMFSFDDHTITSHGVAERVHGVLATPSLFRLLEAHPLVGRLFLESEGETGDDQKVILSYGMWQQEYGGKSDILGRALLLSGRPFTIVGIMPPRFVFIDPEARFWIPLAFTPQERTIHHSNNWYNIGLLKPGASIQQAQAQVDALNMENLQRFPQWREALLNAGFHTAVEPLQKMVVRDVEGALYLLWGGSGLVLLIGALNVLNLSFARTTLRTRELATRFALGANRRNLAGQLIMESLFLVGLSGISGVMLGVAFLKSLQSLGLQDFPRAYEVHVDLRVVLVAILLTLIVAVGSAIVPFVTYTGRALTIAQRETERTGTSGKSIRRLRQGFVVTQIGFAFALLMCATLLLVSFRRLVEVNPGFRTARIVTASVSALASRYASGTQLQSLMYRSLEEIRATPGVLSSGATTTIPFGGDYNDSVMLAEGYVMKPGESLVSPLRISVTPGYLETMQIRLVRGRYFLDSDKESSPPVVIVDERLAQKFWPNKDPIDRRMYEPSLANAAKTDEHTVWYRVVGVVHSVRMEDLSGKGNVEGAYYFPYAQHPSNSFTFAIRTPGDGVAVISTIRAKLATLDPYLALFDVRTMTQRRELSLSSRRTSMSIALAFAILAMLLSAIGVYGVLAYLVAQRRREIGIRIAVGSTRERIVGLILKEAFILVVLGLFLGFCTALALRHALADQIYGIGVLNPELILVVGALLGAVAFTASLIPACRAMRIDPMIVLNDQ